MHPPADSAVAMASAVSDGLLLAELGRLRVTQNDPKRTPAVLNACATSAPGRPQSPAKASKRPMADVRNWRTLRLFEAGADLIRRSMQRWKPPIERRKHAWKRAACDDDLATIETW